MGEGQLNALPLMKKSLGIFSIAWARTRAGVSYLIHYDTLLQNAIDIITRCDSYFITKCDKCDDFITKCDSYYKMRRLLKIATEHMIMEYIGCNWLCKQIKKVRSSQAVILVLNWVKYSFSLWVQLIIDIYWVLLMDLFQ